MAFRNPAIAASNACVILKPPAAHSPDNLARAFAERPLLNLLPYGGRRRALDRGGGEAETGAHDLPVDLIGAIERVIHSAFPCDDGVVVVRADGIGHGFAKAEAAQRARSGRPHELERLLSVVAISMSCNRPASAHSSASFSGFVVAISRIMASTPSEWFSTPCPSRAI